MEETNPLNDETRSSRKRQATPPPRDGDLQQRVNHDSRKRSRHDDGGDGHSRPFASITDSVELLLAVPLEVIFREIGDGSTSSATTTTTSTVGNTVAITQTSAAPPGKPWLTRAEAHCLLRVSMLAHELDVLVRLSEQALSQQQWRRSFRERLTHDSKTPKQPQQHQPGTTQDKSHVVDNHSAVLVHPFLRSILPILEIQEQFTSVGCLEYVQMELDRILLGLEMCAVTLRQSSEQNFTLADNLLDTLDDGLSSPLMVATTNGNNTNSNSSGRTLAQEKRKLAELEEELCHRVDSLIRDTSNISNNNSSSSNDRAIDPAAVDAAVTSTPAESILSDASSCVGVEHSRNILTDYELEPMRDFCARILGLSTIQCSASETWASSSAAASAGLRSPQQRVLFPPSAGSQEDVNGDDDGVSSCPPPKRRKSFNGDALSHDKEEQDGDDDGGDDDENLYNNENSLRSPPPAESQNSYMQKSNAAEALAVLAFGR